MICTGQIIFLSANARVRVHGGINRTSQIDKVYENELTLNQLLFLGNAVSQKLWYNKKQSKAEAFENRYFEQEAQM